MGQSEPNDWKPPTEFPDLSVYPTNLKFGIDTEYRSRGQWDTDLAGISLCTPDKKTFYFPVSHRGGGNLDENVTRRWAKRELAHRHLCCLNFKGDNEVMLKWGVNLEELDCKLHDPAFKAGLLDENRRKYNLNELSNEFLNRSKKATSLAPEHIADMAAWEVGEYAEEDAKLHLELDEKLQIKIDEEDLGRVCELEDELIYCTSAMERAGGLIDRPKLESWIKEVELAHQTAILELFRIAGMRVNPNSIKDLTMLFSKLGIPIPKREIELGGDETFEEEYLRRIENKYPIVKLVMAARKLDSLNSKYLKKYLKNLDSNNILRYNLHQLRSDEYGTVTGRYASAAPKEGGINVQQVMKVESQLEEEEIAQWIVRELFIPENGKVYVSADANQIEFRWFVHYSKSVRLITQYVSDPEMDFHQLVADLLNQKRKDAKHNNFGKLYTMGIVKLARRLGYPCDCGCPTDVGWKREEHSKFCRMQKAFELNKEYDEKFPEAKKLTEEAMRVAKDRGYVRTVLGRRRRYPDSKRLHTALNAIIQGTAADTLKVKLVETHRHRKFLTINLRATVHDELDGDLENPDRQKEFKELLEAPDERIKCKVPLLWKVRVGKNWKECTA